MQQWSDYYERLFNFREIRYFDIKGLKTGLVSKAMTAPDGIVRIPLNESSDPKSQINEYLDAYKGEGIQHIACFTENIYETVEAMRAQGVDFLDTPETYFEVIDQRVPNHGEDVPRLAKNKILIDADPETHQRKLLQIFTQNCIGPIFFEIIQRKGNEGFGEGNFTALFEASSATRSAAACCRSAGNVGFRSTLPVRMVVPAAGRQSLEFPCPRHHRPRLPVRLRQRIRHRGSRRRAAGRTELTAEGGPRPVRRTVDRHRLHCAARQQPP